MPRKNAQRGGFTLIELLFSVAIAGVLAAIAVPTYIGYIDKVKNGTAISDITIIQQSIERFYTVNFQYPATLAAISASLPNNGLDPWGNAYVYLNIINGGPGIQNSVRRDRNITPINSLYDLYSMGKNGVTKRQLDNKDSADDIVLGRDGAFVGLASDF